MFAPIFGSKDRPPAFLDFRSSKWFITATVASSIFTDIFTYSLVVPVFPFALTSRAGVDPDHVQQWVSILLAVYGAALLATSPLFGWLSDRMGGRQLPFLMGLVLLAAATVMLCVGDSLALFVVARLIQGASASVVWIVGLALLVDTVGPAGAGVAMGYVGLAMSAALLLGPLLGGIVLQAGGYYAVYAMAFGLIGMDIVMRLVMIEKSRAARWLSQEGAIPTCSPIDDEKSAGTNTNGDDEAAQTAATATEQLKSPETPQQSPSNAAEALARPTSSTMERVLAKMPPVVLLFGSRRVLCALWATFIISTFFTAFDSILPLYVKHTFGWNSLGAGLIFLPICIATFIGPVIGSLSDKYGPRWFAGAGFVLSCPVLILLRLVHYNSLGQKALLSALLFLLGLGLDLSLTPVMAEVAYAIEAKAARRPPGFYGKNGAIAQAYSLFNMAWAAGSITGPLLGGFVNEAKGWGTTTLILGCVSVFTAVPTVMWTGGSYLKVRRNREIGTEKCTAGVT